MAGSKNYFNSISGEWDKMREEFFGTEVREFAFELAKVEEGKVAVDIGAGTGFITEGLLKSNLKVIAIDQAENMIKTLNERYGKNPNFACYRGDSNTLPLEDDSCDYAFANMYLHHVENPLRAIKEIYRVLKPNGKVVITDLDEHKHEFLKKEQFDIWMGFDRNQMTEWYRTAGFSNIDIKCIGEKCKSQSTCSCSTAEISIFAAFGIK